MKRKCGHGRPISHRVDCPGCLLRIRPDHYWQMVGIVNRRLGIRRPQTRAKRST